MLSPEETKVGFSNQLTETEQFNMIQYLYFNNGAGIAAGDINNDGMADLFISNLAHPRYIQYSDQNPGRNITSGNSSMALRLASSQSWSLVK